MGLLDTLFGTNTRFMARVAGKLPVFVVGVDDASDSTVESGSEDEAADAGANPKKQN